MKEGMSKLTQYKVFHGYYLKPTPPGQLDDEDIPVYLAADVEAVLSEYSWRSVYPTKEGRWWHKGPDGSFIRQVRMAPSNCGAHGLWPYDADTDESLWNIEGDWAFVLDPHEATRLLARLEET